jgi:putative two-component system response regulator
VLNPKPNVLIVDDEPLVGEMIREELSTGGFDCSVASEPAEAVRLLDSQGFDALVTDISMSPVSGLDLLAHVKRMSLPCRVILITGNSNRDLLAQALVVGAYDYIEKPLKMEELTAAVYAATNGKADCPRLLTKAADAIWLRSQTKLASLESVWALVRAVEAKDSYTRRHSEQVAYYATHFAQMIRVPEAAIDRIRIASLLHDVGKIGVPDSVLIKPGPLTDEEFEHMRRHPALGADILSKITIFSQEALLVRHHHENWDGHGYPDGLSGEEIPLGARIIQVADCVDAMLMERTYKKGYPVEQMLAELVRCAGTQFDPRVATAALAWCQSHREALFLSSKAAPARQEVA